MIIKPKDGSWYGQRKSKEHKEDVTAQRVTAVKLNTVIQVKPNSSKVSWRGVICQVIEMEDAGVKVVSVAPDAGRPTMIVGFFTWKEFIVIGQAKWAPRAGF